MSRVLVLLTFFVASVCLIPTHAQPAKKDVTPADVLSAITKGVDYLKTHQSQAGHWEKAWNPLPPPYAKNGLTCLALLALMECGQTPNSDAVSKGLEYLRNYEPDGTYVAGLHTMVFAKADPDRHKLLIQRNVKWLKDSVVKQGDRIHGWGYGKGSGRIGTDNSNTQYALLGLHAAVTAGVPIDETFWKQIQEYYQRSQTNDGGWGYHPHEARGARLTMTSAGVCGLLIAGMQLYKDAETIELDGTIRNCGQFEKNDPLARGLKRMGEMFTVHDHHKFYNLYGIERAGRLSGQRFFSRGDKSIDWYRAGAEMLVAAQNETGAWDSDAPLEGNPVLATSFALLFLSKGKTPVLIHKMMHGRGQRGQVGDWNNDRNDVRNLTEYCSQKIFKKLPLTWQAFDGSQLEPGDPRAVAEMKQAPVLYFNGHNAPYFTAGEKYLLKQYIEQGGFIFAEACCSRKEFDEGFRKLAGELWPDRPLTPLSGGHPLWTAFAAVPPGSFKLEGIDFGCKTCIVYAPEDMSCHWESNRFESRENERTVLAFRTGANIVAYATGLEPPQDKLSHIDLVNTADDKIKRNYLHVAQINYGGRDWQPAPNAMRAVMDHLRKEWNVDVILQTKAIALGDPNLFNYKFLYMHGRRNFTISPEYQKSLRGHLEMGGILLADACCGNKAFDESFRAFVREMFGRDLEPIKLNDPLLTERIGRNIQTVQCRTEAGTKYRGISPQLEGIRLDPKNPRSPWVVVYSKYDLGCALDKHSSPDCLGHSHESALEIAAQVVLYALKE